MKVAYLSRATGVALLILIALGGASGKTHLENDQKCAGNIDYARLNYTIRDARIDDPWAFLHLGNKASEAEKAVAALKGKRYEFNEVDAAFNLVEKERLLNTDFSYSKIERVNYSADELKLDIVFTVFSLGVAPLFTSTFEFNETEKNHPPEEAGAAHKKTLFFVPSGGYD